MEADRPRHDVVVIGGGPAGSTAAALLASEGFDVVLLERTRFPRFHIGESLLPLTLPILDRIGALDAVRRIGIEKFGADFTEIDGRCQAIRFDRALNDAPGAAFQVERAAFDKILLDAARKRGTQVLEETTVRAVDLDDPGGVTLEIENAAGRSAMRARQLIDASGRDGVLARKLDLRVMNNHHQSAAVFSHFKDVPFREGSLAGNISIYWFDHGWLWFIPLPDGVMSVGAVSTTDYFKSRAVPLEQFLDDTIARAPEAARRMQGATRIAPVRAASNYSYGSKHMAGRNYLLIGDAFAFVDPVFSSGVHLAINGASYAAEVINARLRSPRLAEARLRDMQRRVQRGIAYMSWLIYRVRTPAIRFLFMNPRNVLGVEQTVISILAGDIFETSRLAWRYAIFKVIYYLHAARFRFQAPSETPVAVANVDGAAPS